MNFYSKFIPYFENRATPLCTLAKLEMKTYVENLLTPAHHTARADLIGDLVYAPCIARHDCTKRNYLLTGYSWLGFGYEMFQPSDDPGFLSTMQREVEGGNCEFLLPKSQLELCPTGFGSRACCGKEGSLHYHLGEAISHNWAINKNCAKLWVLDSVPLQTAMHSALFSLMMVLTLSFWDFKCGLCFVKWILTTVPAH